MNEDLFPLPDLFNINELGQIVCQRLRNNRTIILSCGKIVFVFSPVNMWESRTKSYGVSSPSMPILCCACETGFKTTHRMCV